MDIGGDNGNFGLIVHDYSADGNLPAEFKLIDETSSAADNFYLVGNAVDVGAFRYNLQHDGDDWVLHRTQEHTDSSLIAKIRTVRWPRYFIRTLIRCTTVFA